MSRSLFVGFAILVLAGCVDTFEPTGPISRPDPDPEGGEFTEAVSSGPAYDGSALAPTVSKSDRREGLRAATSR